MKSWIYQSTKEQLQKELETLGIDSTGTVDQLRKRLSRHVSEHLDTVRTPVPMTDRKDTAPPLFELPDSDPARAMNQIRKWGCHFDGKDPLAFLERLDELRRAYHVNQDQLLLGLPEVLRGDSLLWYRNNRDTWETWDEFEQDFRQTYLPPRYVAQMRREIQGRVQRADEPYRKYETAMLTMMRRTGAFSAEERLDQLYENLYPEYKTRIRRDELKTANDLRDRAGEYETLEVQLRALRKTRDPAPAAVAATYNRNDHCWRCKQRGHTRQDCQRPFKRFCSQCGKDGVLTRECHPRSENSARTGA